MCHLLCQETTTPDWINKYKSKNNKTNFNIYLTNNNVI